MTSERPDFPAQRFLVMAICGAIWACRPISTAIPDADSGARAGPPFGALVTGADAASAAADVSSHVPDLAPRPPYDLDADVRSRIDAARMRFGSATRSAIVGDAFVLIAADPIVSLDAASSLARQALAAYLNGRFERSPDRAVTVLLFNGASDYGAYCRKDLGLACDQDLGAYSVLRSEILVNARPGLGTLTHEMVHPIVQHDFPLAPQWLNEGVASLFEAPVFPSPGEIHGAPNWRMPILARALESPDGAPRPHLEALFAMSDRDFVSRDRSLHYAMARGFCEWLDDRGELWPFYRAWRDGFQRDPDGRLAFQSVEHRTPAEATGAWVQWVLEKSRGHAR